MQISTHELTAKEVLPHLIPPNTWYWGNSTGEPLGVHNIKYYLHRNDLTEYTTARDKSRAQNIDKTNPLSAPPPPYWSSNSIGWAFKTATRGKRTISEVAHAQRIILDWTHHGRNVQKTQRKKGIADNESTHCPYCRLDDDSQQHILCECAHPPIREIRDEVLTKLESMITRQSNLAPEQQAKKDYLKFLVNHMPNDSRGHRFWIGNLDAEAFSFLYHFAGDLRYAPVNSKDIREIHDILWDGVLRMMSLRNAQIREA